MHALTEPGYEPEDYWALDAEYREPDPEDYWEPDGEERECEPGPEWFYESAWVELVDAIAEHRVVGVHIVQELGGRITPGMWRDVAEAVQARQREIAKWRAADSPEDVHRITYDVASRVARRWWENGDEHAAALAVPRPAAGRVCVSSRPRARGRRRRLRVTAGSRGDPPRDAEPADLEPPGLAAGLPCARPTYVNPVHISPAGEELAA